MSRTVKILKINKDLLINLDMVCMVVSNPILPHVLSFYLTIGTNAQSMPFIDYKTAVDYMKSIFSEDESFFIQANNDLGQTMDIVIIAKYVSAYRIAEARDNGHTKYSLDIITCIPKITIPSTITNGNQTVLPIEHFVTKTNWTDSLNDYVHILEKLDPGCWIGGELSNTNSN